MSLHLRECESECVHARVCAFAWAPVYTRMCMSVHVYAQVHAREAVHMRVCLHVCGRECVHVGMCVCPCV